MTKSKLETRSRKHVHGNTFGNTFTETHSNFEFHQLKIKRKGFESPIPLKTMIKCKSLNKKNHQRSLGFGVKIP